MNVIKKVVLLLAIGLCAVVTVNGQDIQQAIDAIENEQYAQAKSVLNGINTAESQYYLGDIALKEGDMEAAKAAFQKGIQADDEFPLNYVGLGRIDLSNENTAAAQANFAKAEEQLRRKVRDPRTYIEIMKAYGKAGMYDKGVEYGQKAIAVDDENASLYIALGDIYALRDGTNLSNAVANYDKAIALNPENPEVYTRLAVAWFRAQNMPRAQEFLDKAIQVDPEFAPAYRTKADIFYLSDSLNAAIEVYESKYLALSNRSCEALTTYVQMLFMNGDAEKANKEIAGLRQNCSGIPQMDRMEGIAAYETGDYQKAATALEKFVSSNPEEMIQPFDYIYLGKAYAQLGQGDKIGGILDKAIAISDSTNQESIMKVYDEMITAFEDAEKWAEAGKIYQEKIDKFESYPKKNADLQSMAIAYTKAKDYQMADQAIAQLIEKEPEFIGGYVMRAQIHAQDTSDFAAAKPHYEKLISVIGDKVSEGKNQQYLAEAYNYLGAYYYTVEKDIDKSIASFEKTLEYDPSNSRAANAAEQLKKVKEQMEARQRALEERAQQQSGG
ncbi:tetratricopeptide repeat protein [Anseongella ginsenosidimutans]|uniref:Tetratricopeptide repeat protein n=1 Tax=Anseongella ginsenosidimutans TaxID=496056 RepID=A0A4R3KVR9_9SPHI|nr:tetratricopeptide repeat protein [Anseongella ginsenosidimutans]QEC51687.1 tetratricopeptide repeat protein [Anseongella ginsenosidimutans]TCS89044.1 tetratricopeptide repeat protein [Anseongella ginsenosidimutans]